MARAVFFEWEADGYLFDEKSPDWFWSLGIVAVASALASALFGNVILALLILAASGSLALSVMRRPTPHVFRITDEGIMVDAAVYPYESIVNFSVLEYLDPQRPPALSLKTHKILAPHLLLPIVGPDPLEIYEFLADHIEEGRHDESMIDRVIEALRL